MEEPSSQPAPSGDYMMSAVDAAADPLVLVAAVTEMQRRRDAWKLRAEKAEADLLVLQANLVAAAARVAALDAALAAERARL